MEIASPFTRKAIWYLILALYSELQQYNIFLKSTNKEFLGIDNWGESCYENRADHLKLYFDGDQTIFAVRSLLVVNKWIASIDNKDSIKTEDIMQGLYLPPGCLSMMCRRFFPVPDELCPIAYLPLSGFTLVTVFVMTSSKPKDRRFYNSKLAVDVTFVSTSS